MFVASNMTNTALFPIHKLFLSSAFYQFVLFVRNSLQPFTEAYAIPAIPNSHDIISVSRSTLWNLSSTDIGTETVISCWIFEQDTRHKHQNQQPVFVCMAWGSSLQ